MTTAHAAEQSLEQNTRTIDGDEYLFTKFGAKKALQVFFKLSAIVGEPMAVAFGSLEPGKKKVLDADMNMEGIGKAIAVLTSRLDHPDAIQLIETIAGSPACLCNGKQIVFDKHYEGRLDHLLRVVTAAMEVQYGNFFGAILGSLPVQRRTSTPAPTT
jgi:hypothetical protein